MRLEKVLRGILGGSSKAFKPSAKCSCGSSQYYEARVHGKNKLYKVCPDCQCVRNPDTRKAPRRREI